MANSNSIDWSIDGQLIMSSCDLDGWISVELLKNVDLLARNAFLSDMICVTFLHKSLNWIHSAQVVVLTCMLYN